MQMIAATHHIGYGVGFQTGGVYDGGGGKFKAFAFDVMRENPIVAGFFFYPCDLCLINNLCFPA